MIPITEIQRRAETGLVMNGNEFDIAFSRKVREVVAKYNIKFNREELVVDEPTADRVYQAGVELLSNVGLYHTDTQRVVHFDKEEIENVAREIREGPRTVVFGTGKEEVCYQFRTINDKRPVVLVHGPQAGANMSIEQELFIPFAQSFAQEELNLGLGSSGGLTKVDGIEAKTGTPSEVFVALWEGKALLEVSRRVGRPGMHLGVPNATSVGAILALITSGLRGRSNMQIAMHIIPELKINWTRLMLACVAEESGIAPSISAMSIMGALSRGPEDTAVAAVANWLGQLAYGHGLASFIWLNDMKGNWTFREILWAYSAALRAAERNICMPTGGCTAPENPYQGTELGMYWQAVSALTFSASGVSFTNCGSSTGLEARLTGEVLNAVAGIERGKANRLIETIYARFETHKNEISGPKSFQDLYDVQRIQPKPEHLADYQHAKEELTRMGVSLK